MLTLFDFDQKIINFQVIDLFGRVINSDILKNNQIDVSTLAAGVYFLKLENENLKLTKRFVVEKK